MPSAFAARFTSRGLTHMIAPKRPAPATIALVAVTLIFASPSFVKWSTSTPVRSSPSMTNAFFGPTIFHLAAFGRSLERLAALGHNVDLRSPAGRKRVQNYQVHACILQVPQDSPRALAAG